MSEELSALTVAQAIELLERIAQHRGGNRELRVMAQPLGDSLGSTPSVDVTWIVSGFDWDIGTVFMCLRERVRPIDETYERERESFRQTSERLGWIRNILRGGLSAEGKLKAIEARMERGKDE